MSNKGGKRINSGRKKGSIPWNKGIPMREETKKILSKNAKGKPAWNKGIPMSIESRLKISEHKKGKKIWPNGRLISQEAKLKMSLAKIGKPSPLKGRKLSAEVKAEMSLRRQKYFKNIDPKYVYILDTSTRKGNKRVRRERIRNNGGSHSIEEWELLKSSYNFTCPRCNISEPDIKLTRDHIIAISAGGTNNIVNIQPLCSVCNASKGINHIRY